MEGESLAGSPPFGPGTGSSAESRRDPSGPRRWSFRFETGVAAAPPVVLRDLGLLHHSQPLSATTEAASGLMARWEDLPSGMIVEMSGAMMQLTLEIISRSMFSSDSDDIAEIVRESAERHRLYWRATACYPPAWRGSVTTSVSVLAPPRAGTPPRLRPLPIYPIYI